MNKSRRSTSIIACTTVLALLLAGCEVNIEPTDLSAVTVENDRTTIEKSLGKPVELIVEQDFTVASYAYDKGYYAPAEAPTGISRPPSTAGGGLAGLGWLVITAVAAPIDHAVRTSKARPGQIGKLAAVYDVHQKLVFVGSLDDQDGTVQNLEDIAAEYKATRLDDAEALFRLSEIAIIPEQRQTLLRSAAAKGNADASYELGIDYRYGNGVTRDVDVAEVWLTKAANADYSKAQTALSELSETKKRFKTILARAKDGDIEILMSAADAHRFGNGVPKDVDLAIWIYERATVKKNDFAAYALGKIYSDGETGIKNLSRSYMWFSIGEQIAVTGKEELAKLRIGVAQEMNPAQISAAERMSREWLQTYSQ